MISGGLGSGGSYLAEWIIDNIPGVQIWIPARWHSTATHRNINKIKDKIIIREVDLNDLGSIIRFLQECKPKKVFNMAATANVHIAFITPLAVLQNNIMSSANLLEAVRMICPETIFQQCSTSEVIGTPVTMPITEEHQLNASNPYAISKLATEKLACCYHYCWKIPVVISRAFCYINPRRADLFATSFALQIARIEQGKQKVLRHGNLGSVRTIMDIREMSEAYWVASEKCAYAIPYNIGGTDPISVGGVLDILKSKAKVPIICEQNPLLLRASDITNQVPDISRFYNKTGWRSKITMDESLEWLLKNCRENIANEKT